MQTGYGDMEQPALERGEGADWGSCREWRKAGRIRRLRPGRVTHRTLERKGADCTTGVVRSVGGKKITTV